MRNKTFGLPFPIRSVCNKLQKNIFKQQNKQVKEVMKAVAHEILNSSLPDYCRKGLKRQSDMRKNPKGKKPLTKEQIQEEQVMVIDWLLYTQVLNMMPGILTITEVEKQLFNTTSIKIHVPKLGRNSHVLKTSPSVCLELQKFGNKDFKITLEDRVECLFRVFKKVLFHMIILFSCHFPGFSI